ncbi:DsbA family protein [Croceibacterium ferulae]|uniref:DsbA family protein n=1 Tax=Croceibacterium ferulae TaxID=1854641 RepID=UPI000EB2A2F9|nr:thioredoxin domain-containing protein [Croceibacterium ferulae]
MRFTRLLQVLAIGLAASVTVAAAGNWPATVSVQPGGHTVGNPAAPVTLTEYVSYTCPHCAAFTRAGEAPLEADYVAPGRLKVEVRHLLRNPVDLTVAMLVNCGAPARVQQNHLAFMRAQPDWLPRVDNATPAQRTRWTTGEDVARRRAIASDVGLYAIAERRGVNRAAADRCLADQAKATRLAEASDAGWKLPGITGTPSFALNGTVLAGTHDWSTLEWQLAARYRDR